jgi:drug/metabolite transporter (DMT)-like permease
MKQKTSAKHAFLLLLAAFVWGTAFVAQDTAADTIEPFTFLCMRSIIACIFLFFMIRIFDKKGIVTQKPKTASAKKTLWTGGILCGIILCFASYMQQAGMTYTTAGKAGFITALYIIFVPIVGIFFKKYPSPLLIASVILAIIGFYFLCLTESFSLSAGDSMILICSFIYTAHIMVIDHFSPQVDGVRLSFIQFLMVAILSFFFMLFFEHPTLSSIQSAMVPILYAGIMSSGIGYTCQILGQEKVNPSIACLLMSLESVFSVLSGWIILGENMSGREVLGCILVFAGVILAQLPFPRKSDRIE